MRSRAGWRQRNRHVVRGMRGGIEAAKSKHDLSDPTDYVYFDYGQGDPATSRSISAVVPVKGLQLRAVPLS